MSNMVATHGAGSMFDSATHHVLPRPGSALSSTSIENIVNPLGKVTTIVRAGGGAVDPMTDSFQSQDIVFPDQYIHENCDEALFRPVVTIVEQKRTSSSGKADEEEFVPQAPARMNTNLIVPVIVPTIPKAPITTEVAKKEAPEKPDLVVVEIPEEEPPKVAMDEEAVKVEDTPAVVLDTKPTKSAKQQKNNKKNNNNNKEKTPPPPPAPPAEKQQSMIVSISGSEPQPGPQIGTKANGSKGRKSSGQEPKTGKMRKSDKAVEMVMNVEEEVREIELSPPPPAPQMVVPMVEPIISVVEVDEKMPLEDAKSGTGDFEHLSAVEEPIMEVVKPTKQEMEIIQDSLLKGATVVTTITTVNTGGGKKGKKNRQKTPPKVVMDEEPVILEMSHEELKNEMMVDISETRYDLSQCIEGDAEFEAQYADPLAPLEPFEIPVTFEAVECPPDADDVVAEQETDESLMTFESGAAEEKKKAKATRTSPERDEKLEKLQKVFTDRNLVFAMCTSWREQQTGEEKEHEPEKEADLGVGLLPQLEIYEDYMDLDRSEKKLMMESMNANKLSAVLTASTGSSEGEVSSSSSNSSGGEGKTTSSSGSGHTTTTATEDDDDGGEETNGLRRTCASGDDYDEELQPLIKDKDGSNEGEEDQEPRAQDDDAGGPVVVVTEEVKSKESTPTSYNNNQQQKSSKSKKSRKKKR